MKPKYIILSLLIFTAVSFAQPWSRESSGALTASMNMADASTYTLQTVEAVECRIVSLGRLPERAQVTDIDIYAATAFAANAPKDSVTIGTLADGDFLTTFLSVAAEGIGSPTWNATTDGHSYNAINGTGRDLYLIYWKDSAWPTAGKVVATVSYSIHKRSAR